MPGLDVLISEYLADEIKANLKKNEQKNLERRLFSEHGYSIKQSIEEFGKLDTILQDLLGYEAKNFETRMLHKIISAKETKRKQYEVVIKNSTLSRFLIKHCTDEEIVKILNASFEKPLTISQILTKTKISKTSGYRKISFLVRKGILIKSGFKLSKSKKVEKFEKLCDKIIITIGEEQNDVKLLISKKKFNESSSIKSIRI